MGIRCVCMFSGEEYTKYSLHNVHKQYQWVKDLTKHPQILKVIKAILGPDVILLDSRFICKYPTLKPDTTHGKGETKPDGTVGGDELPYVAWHQDMRSMKALKKCLKLLFCFVVVLY